MSASVELNVAVSRHSLQTERNGRAFWTSPRCFPTWHTSVSKHEPTS